MAQKNQAAINANFFLASTLAFFTWKYWPDASASFYQQGLASLGAGVAGISGLTGGARLIHDVKHRRALLDSREAGIDHGSAREATEAELEARGMFDAGSGTFLGFKFGRAVFTPKDAPFGLYEAPPGSGKDIYFVVGNILHRAMMGYSVFAPDVKLELAPMLLPGLKAAGVECWGINPTKAHLETCGNVELGLFQAIIDAVYSETSNGRKDAVGIAKEIAQLLLPDKQGGSNSTYFSGGARRAIPIPVLLNALVDPAECTPGAAFAMLNDPNLFTEVLQTIDKKLEPMVEDDRIVEYLKSDARNLLSRAEKNEENFGSFLEWATQVLSPYNQAGYLSDYGRAPTNNIKEMCQRPIVAMPMLPFSHVTQFESFTSILNANLLSAAKRNPRQQRIHLCCNEFLNYRFANVGSDLEVMRGLGITADFFIQSFSGLVRKYGQEAAASINDYCDVKVYAGLNSLERARYVSDMLSEGTIARQDYSYRAAPDEVNVSTKRMGRRLMTADEIMAMPRDQAWVFVKGMRPFKVQLKHYGHVYPWNQMVGNNPLEGAPLQGKTLLKIDYAREAANV